MLHRLSSFVLWTTGRWRASWARCAGSLTVPKAGGPHAMGPARANLERARLVRMILTVVEVSRSQSRDGSEIAGET